MYHISGNESLYKGYEYDEGYAMIRVHAWIHIPSPRWCLGTRHSYQQLRIVHGSRPLLTK